MATTTRRTRSAPMTRRVSRMRRKVSLPGVDRQGAGVAFPLFPWRSTLEQASGRPSHRFPMTDLRAQLLEGLSGSYTLERELGRGGMATVFLAQDLKHERPV